MWFNANVYVTGLIQITWLANTPQSPHATAGPIQQWYRSRVEAWARRHPDVKLEVEYLGTDINLGMTQLQEKVAAGRGPPCASVDSFFFPRVFDPPHPPPPPFS